MLVEHIAERVARRKCKVEVEGDEAELTVFHAWTIGFHVVLWEVGSSNVELCCHVVGVFVAIYIAFADLLIDSIVGSIEGEVVPI